MLVTALTPTPAGEGQNDGFDRAHRGFEQNREEGDRRIDANLPSGPVFGIKGGAAGGGLFPGGARWKTSTLHFTGDFNAVEKANNLLGGPDRQQSSEKVDNLNLDPRVDFLEKGH